jgi:ADP-ribosylglycohydrolase
MFLGVAIGDALGMPVELMTYDQIHDKFGLVTDYQDPGNHKWYKGWPPGRWTDDTQCTLAVAESLIANGKIDLDDMARRQIAALNECSIGWGDSSKLSLRKIEQGTSRLISGNPQGAGNGVVMKISPLVVYSMLPESKTDKDNFLVEFTIMTHRSDTAVLSAYAMLFALSGCLQQQPFGPPSIVEILVTLVPDEPFQLYGVNNLESQEAGLIHSLAKLEDNQLIQSDIKTLLTAFGGATCYVANSLPFSLAMFMRGPDKIETLYETVSAGGDTDSNGALVGAMLGAYNGAKIFPKNLIDGLWRKDYVLEVATRFCDRFNIR